MTGICRPGASKHPFEKRQKTRRTRTGFPTHPTKMQAICNQSAQEVFKLAGKGNIGTPVKSCGPCRHKDLPEEKRVPARDSRLAAHGTGSKKQMFVLCFTFISQPDAQSCWRPSSRFCGISQPYNMRSKWRRPQTWSWFSHGSSLLQTAKAPQRTP